MKTGGLFYLSLAFILFCCPALHRRHLPPAFQREVIDMNKTYLRGDMYYADLGRGIGSEQEGYRPVLIIQNDTGNKHSPTVIVAAISSKVDAKAKLPTHYLLKAENGLELPSLVLMEQLRTIDKRRLETYIGHLEEQHTTLIFPIPMRPGSPAPSPFGRCGRNMRRTSLKRWKTALESWSARRIWVKHCSLRQRTPWRTICPTTWQN